MATNSEVIKARLNRYGIEIQDAELDAHAVDTALVLTDEYSINEGPAVKRVLALVLRDLLVMPDLSEGQISIKWDRAAVKAYYGMLCKELGLVNEFIEIAPQPTIQNKSYLW